MENSQNWSEALNISSESLSAWSEEAPEGVPLLVWCLREGKISLELYLDWAVEAYGLPHLNSMFFHEAFFPGKLSAYVERSEWTPWFFPINLWDDVVTVACVEPPQELLDGKFSYVLCDPQVLSEMFQRFQAGEAVTTPNFELPQDEAPAPEAPLGMSLEPKAKFTLNFSDIGESTAAAVADPPVVEEEEELIEPSLVLQKTQITALRPPPAPPAIPKVSVTDSSSPALDKVMDQAFEDLKREYQTALIFKCEGNVATPFRWHSELAEIDTERAVVDLSSPSLFRIVSRTLQPYHGYAVSSPIHEEFFSSLNLIVIPSCVTAVPVMVGGEMWGILIALGAESAHGQDALNHAREIADHLGTAFNNEVPAHEAA